MDTPRQLTLFVNNAGDVEYIHDDDLSELLADIGPEHTVRASHVEHIHGIGWEADMRPSGGPILPPTRRRDDALMAERQWIVEHLFS